MCQLCYNLQNSGVRHHQRVQDLHRSKRVESIYPSAKDDKNCHIASVRGVPPYCSSYFSRCLLNNVPYWSSKYFKMGCINYLLLMYRDSLYYILLVVPNTKAALSWMDTLLEKEWEGVVVMYNGLHANACQYHWVNWEHQGQGHQQLKWWDLGSKRTSPSFWFQQLWL